VRDGSYFFFPVYLFYALLSLSLYFQMHFLFFLIVFCSLILMLSEPRLTLAGRWASLGEESLQCQAVSIVLSCSGLYLTVVVA